LEGVIQELENAGMIKDVEGEKKLFCVTEAGISESQELQKVFNLHLNEHG